MRVVDSVSRVSMMFAACYRIHKMDYSTSMRGLENASLFDLYRLDVAIRNEMENPRRIEEVRSMVAKGDTISYFEGSANRLIEAEVIEVRRTRVLVKNKHDQKQWNIPFYTLNIEQVATEITYPASPKGMAKNEIRIGDQVGFRDKAHRNVHGKVLRLNPRTVTVFVEPNEQWRVPYSALYPIVDGEKAYERRFIEGVVVEADPTAIADGLEDDAGDQ